MGQVAVMVLLVLAVTACAAQPPEVAGLEGFGPVAVSSVAYSPDGSRIAVAAGPDPCLDVEEDFNPFALRIYDAQMGALLDAFSGHVCRAATVGWSPDGLSLVSSGEDGFAYVWDAQSGEILASSESSGIGSPPNRRGAAWKPDAQVVVDMRWPTQYLEIWRAADGVIEATIGQSGDAEVTAFAWSPAGDRLAVGRADQTLQMWDVAGVGHDGTARLVNTFTQRRALALSWSPDGRRLALGSEGITIINAGDGQVIRSLSGHSDSVLTLAWNPVRALLASGGVDSTVMIWDLNTGEQLDHYTANGWVLALAWNPSGDHLAYGSMHADPSALLTIQAVPTRE